MATLCKSIGAKAYSQSGPRAVWLSRVLILFSASLDTLDQGIGLNHRLQITTCCGR